MLNIKYFLSDPVLTKIQSIRIANWAPEDRVSISFKSVRELSSCGNGISTDPFLVADFINSEPGIWFIEGDVTGGVLRRGECQIQSLPVKHPISWSLLEVFRNIYQCLPCDLADCSMKSELNLEPRCIEKISAIDVEDLLRLVCLSRICSGTKDEMTGLCQSYMHVLDSIDLSLYSPIIRDCASKNKIRETAQPGSPLRTWLIENSSKINEEKEGLLTRYGRSEKFKSKYPIVIPCRKWNSWTPNQPSGTECSSRAGGGYFISDGTTNIALDPGFGFIDMLNMNHQISVLDLDAIIVSHDHPDHWAELQNILGLIVVYSRKYPRKLDIYLNQSSYYLFERLVSYYKAILLNGTAIELKPDTQITIGSIAVSCIDMLHDEIIDKIEGVKPIAVSCALGFKFQLRSTEHQYEIVVPGDTSFPEDTVLMQKWAEFYTQADLACMHLGSLEEGWGDEAHLQTEADKISYGFRRHLGLTGLIRFLNIIDPKVSVITEFGEELEINHARIAIGEVVKSLLHAKESLVMPSDVGLAFTFIEGQSYVKCEHCSNYVHVSKIEKTINEKNRIIYSYICGCKSELFHISKDRVLYPSQTQ